jgi:putative oxidoreductase
MLNSIFFLRIAVAIILLMHSIPSIATGSVNEFGKLYLDAIGFAPFGIYLAWAIKLSHVVCAICFLFQKFMKSAAIITILILLTGIIILHAKEGWFVVGGGRNGVEFNFLLIFVLLILFFLMG